MDAFRLEGAALATIGGLLNSEALAIALDVAEALGWVIPRTSRRAIPGTRILARRQWIESLTVQSASNLLTAIAVFVELKLKLPSARIEQLQQSAIGNIAKRAIPWLAKPKAAAGKKARRRRRASAPTRRSRSGS
jgi:hypothetical protein